MAQMNGKHGHVDTATTAQSPAPAVAQQSGGVSTTTLVILLVLSSVLSSALGPLVQSGLKFAAEAYLGLPPNAADQFRLQQQPPQEKFAAPISSVAQPQASPVALKPRAEPNKSQFGCKHDYQAFILNRDPMVIYLEDFLQPGEADHMIELAKPKMMRSRVVGEQEYSDSRTSSSAYLESSQDNVVKCIEERASLFTNISMEATEPLQVVWYTKGQEFRPHHDYLERKDLKNDYWSRYGQRYTTFLVYLNEPELGGGTLFSSLGFELEPRKNAAIFWYNVNYKETEDSRTLHGGSPVEGGEKYAINIWQRKMLPDLAPFIQNPNGQDKIHRPKKPAIRRQLVNSFLALSLILIKSKFNYYRSSY
ncbi:hypothetical protein BDF19DRAFT_478657 [Syncephalis fuscata]|nr:hypothetical protein BDF19DRAFT_478657 [Syncephalis fuscata]